VRAIACLLIVVGLGGKSGGVGGRQDYPDEGRTCQHTGRHTWTGSVALAGHRPEA